MAGTIGHMATLRRTRISEAEFRTLTGETPPHTASYPEGPWVAALIVGVEGPVRSKSNYRRRGSHQTWAELAEFSNTISQVLTSARPAGWPDVEVERNLEVASRHMVIGAAYARGLIDTPNLSKSLYDAAEGILYPNDVAVRAEYSAMERGRGNQRLVWGVAVLDPHTDPTHILSATVALAEETHRVYYSVDASLDS